MCQPTCSTANSTAQMKKVFYEMLDQQLDQIKYWNKILILAGDLNVRVGYKAGWNNWRFERTTMIMEMFSLMRASRTIWESVIHSSNIRTYTDIHGKDHR